MQDQDEGRKAPGKSKGALTRQSEKKYEVDIQREQYELPKIEETPNYKKPIYWIVVAVVLLLLALLPVINEVHKRASETDDYVGSLLNIADETISPPEPEPEINIDAEVDNLRGEIARLTSEYVIFDLSKITDINEWQADRLRGELSIEVERIIGKDKIRAGIEAEFLKEFTIHEYRRAMKDMLPNSEENTAKLERVRKNLRELGKKYYLELDETVYDGAIGIIGETDICLNYLQKELEPVLRARIIEDIYAEKIAKYELNFEQRERFNDVLVPYVRRTLPPSMLIARVMDSVSKHVIYGDRYKYLTGRLEDDDETRKLIEAEFKTAVDKYRAEHDESFDAAAQSTQIDRDWN